VGCATSGRGQGSRLTEWDRAWGTHWDVASKDGGIDTLKLALEESIELGVLRCLLAVRDTKAVGLLQGVKMKAPLPQLMRRRRTALRGCCVKI
jgi:hypothetical protein